MPATSCLVFGRNRQKWKTITRSPPLVDDSSRAFDRLEDHFPLQTQLICCVLLLIYKIGREPDAGGQVQTWESRGSSENRASARRVRSESIA